MSKQLFGIIWLEGLIAFLIPFASVLGAALAPYAAASSVAPSIIAWVIMLSAAMVAGLSALKSFLSTTVSDAKDNIAAPQPKLEQVEHPLPKV